MVHTTQTYTVLLNVTYNYIHLTNVRNIIIFEHNLVDQENAGVKDLYLNTLVNTSHGQKAG